ncbi:tyrosine-type recombinase/integrase [Cellulosimicrobium cellulans]|uniref:tyrosine-type recombinase/integrase n=1 Tax=Cellulosimicrobium cellulans TaxID=1710 RepID=UPI002405379F|nr:tyrosine-type recombinase/integrase [Cellulosimicrobium cellulans]MDF9874806.1 integrase [Cellulosimicrobium cellulans]
MATVEPYTTSKGERRYRVRYRTPDRRQTDRRGFRTKRDAQAFAATLEVSKLRGEYIEPAAARVTVGELGASWLDRQAHLKPSTLRVTSSAWRTHVEPRWGRIAVSDVLTSDVQAWVSELTKGRAASAGRSATSGKSATTVRRAHGVLAAILDDAVRDRRTLTNAARGVDLPRKVPSERVYLTHEQVGELAREAKGHGTLVLVLAYCGLRWGEAVELRVRDLDMLRRRIVVRRNAVQMGSRIVVGTPKTHHQRSVPFPRFLSLPLAAACEGKPADGLVFAAADGAYLKRPDRASGGWFSGAVRRAGVPEITPHGLRHTAASLAVSAGANVKAVQRMLGHASASMTLDVYADLFDADLDAVADSLDHAASRAGVGKVWATGATASV